jgi:hypothetical protein
VPAQAWIKVIRKEPSVKEKEMGEINVDGNKCLGFCPGAVYLWKAQILQGPLCQGVHLTSCGSS